MAKGEGQRVNERAEVPEAVRSRAWAVAKPVALEEWQKGSGDTTQMLICVSRALDAVLADVWTDGYRQAVTDNA